MLSKLKRFGNLIVLLALVLLFLGLLPQVFGHAPLMPGNNETLATATVVPDPTKSWVLYSELHEGGEAQYYRFDILQGQRIHVSLLKSTETEQMDFVPSFVLMGPQLVSQGTVPTYVEMPDGDGSIVVEGRQPSQATYEPFSPSAFYQVAELQMSAPASSTYYVAVYEPSRGGYYGVVIGDRESFTISEWILAPLSFISIYQWEGQPLSLIFAPAAITLAVGILILLWWRRTGETPRTAFQWTGALAGLLFLAYGFTVMYQMLYALGRTPAGPDVVITVIFALIPLILGMATIWIALRRTINVRTRVGMAIIGLIALFAWAGFIVGPVLAVLASVLPKRARSATKSASTS